MTETALEAVTFYWRPGCGFCVRLESGLSRLGIPMRKVNIWEDDSAAATVRSLARGNETVPTVVVGPTGMVNPRVNEVVDALAEHAPHLVPEEIEPEPGLLDRLRGR